MVFLQSPVEFRREIRPICLPEGDGDQFEGSHGLITGWGAKKQVKDERPFFFRKSWY